MTKGLKPIISINCILGGGWLKFSCRYSLYGCMEIIPDALQIRPMRGTGAYYSKKVTAVKYIDWALWIFLCQSWRCVTVCLLIKTSLRSVPRIGISVSGCLTVCDQMTGTASRIWGITARKQRNLRKEGMEICLSTSSNVWASSLPWVGVWHTVKMEPAFSCLGFLSILWLPR